MPEVLNKDIEEAVVISDVVRKFEASILGIVLPNGLPI